MIERAARRLAAGPGREAVELRSRSFAPEQQVAGRVELRGPGVRAGVDVRGDGAVEAWTRPVAAPAGRAAGRRDALRRRCGARCLRARASSRSGAASAACSRQSGHARLEQRPEARRVVHHLEVADLVLDDVVEHVRRRQQQPPVERHRAAATSTTPSACAGRGSSGRCSACRRARWRRRAAARSRRAPARRYQRSSAGRGVAARARAARRRGGARACGPAAGTSAQVARRGTARCPAGARDLRGGAGERARGGARSTARARARPRPRRARARGAGGSTSTSPSPSTLTRTRRARGERRMRYVARHGACAGHPSSDGAVPSRVRLPPGRPRALHGLRQRRAPAGGRPTTKSRGGVLVFDRPLDKEGKLGFWRWFLGAWGIGTYRQERPGRRRLGGRRAPARRSRAGHRASAGVTALARGSASAAR